MRISRTQKKQTLLTELDDTKLYKVTNPSITSGNKAQNTYINTIRGLNIIFANEFNFIVGDYSYTNYVKSIKGIVNRLNKMIDIYNRNRRLRGDEELPYYTFEEIN